MVGFRFHFHLPSFLHLLRELVVSVLRLALAEVVRRHAVLRTTFEVDAASGGFVQCVHEQLEGASLLREESAADDAAAEALVAADAARGFTLLGADACVLRCTVVRVRASTRMHQTITFRR